MSKPNDPTAPAAAEATTETTAPEITTDAATETETAPAKKGFFSRTFAAIAATLAAKKAFDETGAKPEVKEVSAKGMFNEEMEKRKPSLWDLFDILCTVRWQLMDRKWVMEWTELEDDFDYVGEFNVACLEFADAAVQSFTYYGGFATDADSALDADGDGVTDDVVSNAMEIEKAFENLSALIGSATDDNMRKQLREVGASMLEVAKNAGVLFPESAEAGIIAPAAITDEEIRKSALFVETETRASKAESELVEANQNVEAAKAGLEVANAAMQHFLRQPLNASPGTAASS